MLSRLQVDLQHSLGAQTPRNPLHGCSTISTSQPSVSLSLRDETALAVRIISPDVLKPGKAPLEGFQAESLFSVSRET